MWDLSGPGLEPVSPALAGGLLTTVPPGKSEAGIIYWPVAFLHMVIQGLRLSPSRGSAILQGLIVMYIQLAEEEMVYG